MTNAETETLLANNLKLLAALDTIAPSSHKLAGIMAVNRSTGDHLRRILEVEAARSGIQLMDPSKPFREQGDLFWSAQKANVVNATCTPVQEEQFRLELTSAA